MSVKCQKSPIRHFQIVSCVPNWNLFCLECKQTNVCNFCLTAITVIVKMDARSFFFFCSRPIIRFTSRQYTVTKMIVKVNWWQQTKVAISIQKMLLVQSQQDAVVCCTCLIVDVCLCVSAQAFHGRSEAVICLWEPGRISPVWHLPEMDCFLVCLFKAGNSKARLQEKPLLRTQRFSGKMWDACFCYHCWILWY